MTILIGPGRRMTLAELQAVARKEVPLACTFETQGKDDLRLAQHLSLLQVTESANNRLDSSSTTCTLAILAVAALHLGQNKSGVSESVVESLVAMVNRMQKESDAVFYALPTDTTECVQALEKLLATSLPLPLVQRSCVLALNGLAIAQAVSLAEVALPIAALSIDTSGRSSEYLQHSFAEFQFDLLRPNRGMVTSAASLRVLLNASRYKSTEELNEAQDKALADLPQYHGPASTDLKAVYKTMELEFNSQPSKPDTKLDDTVSQLGMEQARNAIHVLMNLCQERMGQTPEVDPDWDFPACVQKLQLLLQEEAMAACQKVQEETKRAAEEAKQKEVQKAARAADKGSSDNKDEFAGMTEAQKAKILKKRAEKEAKAEAKRKAKEQKGVSLFGTGTQPICDVLQESQGELTPGCIDKIVAIQDKLLSCGVQRKPKIPKGTRDYLPEQMMIRQQAFSIIRRVFQAHGAVEIDTPVFELKDTLTGKYGEDSKLIYDLADQGGELLALRYDLTVPFARFLALNSVGNIKRFHIGKVYRRDQPALARGRYREFYQCDFDIAGNYGRMVPDSESVCVVCDILDALPIGDFAVKLNHRCLLDAILDICGVPAEKFRTICSAVDKLDKEPWSEVKREMVEDKGLKEEVADKIGEFVLNKGPPLEMYKELMDSKRFGDHKGALEAMEDLRILFDYLEAMDKLKFVSFDLSLARGLDYYTGVIYEAVCMSGNNQVGSIGGGGRYDNLVSMFQEAGKQTPCVGVSVGIERVFTLMESRLREEQGGSIKQPNVDILIASAGGTMMKEKMKIARILWDAKVSAEFSQQENAKLKKELQNALDRDIPFMVIVGEEELAEKKCTVKDLKAKTEEKVPIASLVSILRQKGVIPVGCEFAAELLKDGTMQTY